MKKESAPKRATAKVASSKTTSTNVSPAAPVTATGGKAKPKTIGRTKVLDIIKANGKSKIFSITAGTKKDPNRVFAGRLTAPKTHQTAGTATESKIAKLGYLLMWDMVNHGWRSVNLQKVTQLKAGKAVYNVR